MPTLFSTIRLYILCGHNDVVIIRALETVVNCQSRGHLDLQQIANSPIWAQPWSTGKVGMIGASYVGWVQWWAASARPPHPVTIIPNVASPEAFYNIPYEYGAFLLWGAMSWADLLESNATAKACWRNIRLQGCGPAGAG